MTGTTDDRRRIAGFLATNGPTHGDRLAERLGMTLARFWPLINCGWFDIVTGGWDLTERGRQEGLGGKPPERPPHPGPPRAEHPGQSRG